MTNKDHPSLLSIRTAVIMLLAILTGVTSVGLAVLSGEGWASSALIAGAATAGAIYLFDHILD